MWTSSFETYVFKFDFIFFNFQSCQSTAQVLKNPYLLLCILFYYVSIAYQQIGQHQNYMSVNLQTQQKPQQLNEQMIEQKVEKKEEEEEIQDPSFKPPLSLKVLVGYLYFIQGVILALPATMTLVYTHLPQTYILSLFSFSTLPFSFKFITAPFIEKYTSLKYGKRKTWIIISQIMTFLMLVIGSFITDQSHQIGLAIVFLFAILFTTLQDISLDAVSIKQLRVPYLVAMLQGIMQTFGIVLGSLAILKGTSKQFGKSVGLDHAITTPQVLILVFSGLIIGPTLIIHLNYKERILESEKKIKNQSLLKIIKYYKVFFQFKTKYARAMAFFGIYLQGFVLYQAYYEYELVKNHDFSRNTINTITNIALIPISIIAIFTSEHLNKFGWVRCMMICLCAKWGIWLLVLIFFPTSVVAISIIYFFTQLIETFRFILTSILINEFPVMGLSGMFITMLNSGANFGRLDSIHIYLTGIWGWHTSAIIGLILQAILIVFFPKMISYLHRGTLQIPGLVGESANQNAQNVEDNTNQLEQSLGPIDTQRQKREIEIQMIQRKSNDDNVENVEDIEKTDHIQQDEKSEKSSQKNEKSQKSEEEQSKKEQNSQEEKIE